MQNNSCPESHVPQDIYDITDQTFGTIRVIALAKIVSGRRFWICECVECHSKKTLPAYAFRSRIPICRVCRRNEMRTLGLLTPDWLMDLGFDEKFHSRFWSKVNKCGPHPSHRPELGPCWIWTAGTNGNGYGSIGADCRTVPAKTIAAHRASWIMASRKLIPEGLDVLHRCDTPRCIRPDHLFLGTPLINCHDMILKGRDVHQKGEAHGNAVLTDAQVVEMRRIRSTTDATYRELAEMFNCSPSTVAWIIRGEYWRHLL